jgi:hypothetical protein
LKYFIQKTLHVGKILLKVSRFSQNSVKEMGRRQGRIQKALNNASKLFTKSILEASTNSPILPEFQMLCLIGYLPCKTLICTRI